MNKLPVKQTYLLLIAVFGVIAISIYSTYAIFTLESSTDNIVSIRTPENLQISSETYEYKQIEIPKNSYVTTDIDIYDNFDYDLCYSIWYKSLNSNVKVYENTTDTLTTSGVVSTLTGKRVSLIIVNDNDFNSKINIGVASAKNEDTCALNISNDKLPITATIDAKSLVDTLAKDTQANTIETGYLTYKDNTDEMNLSEESDYYIASEFTYQDELFTLKEAKKLDLKELNKYQDYYLCKDDSTCETLYHLTQVDSKVTKYDILTGYLGGENGLRKIDKDYYFYGDNPHNFIYYNCTNEMDTKTCELWRIIGFYYDIKSNKYITKIIRNDYLDTYAFDNEKNIWSNSKISKYLNEEYKLKQNIHEEFTFKETNLVSLDTNINEIPFLDPENKAKVLLMNVSDYLYASTCQKTKINEYDETCLKNNWLNRNKNEWTMTTKYELPYTDEETKEEIVPDNNMVYSVGNEITVHNINDKLSIRPVVYLKSRTLLINGDGTLDNPYVIR